jgi:glycosyltransferase involved in cell wall biosynthesis
MHNEEANVTSVHSSLARQSLRDFEWVVVNDGSSDGTASALQGLQSWPVPRVHERQNGGGLIGGSAYSAWRFGIERALLDVQDVTHIMKLDADVVLPENYLAQVTAAMGADVGLAGGVIVGAGMREQAHHVPGPVKLYSKVAYDALGELPSAIGFDVMDEVAIQAAGMRVVVLKEARVQLARAIGASEGSVHGRFRNGRVCRWTGYYFPYFLLHMLRYALRKPYLIGSLAMFLGYVRASEGPYPRPLKSAHSAVQKKKAAALLRSPVRWLQETYRY